MTTERMDLLSQELNKVIDKVEGSLDKELLNILREVSFELYQASES